MNAKELLRLAEEARAKAYAPYSGFTVGAALQCEDGRVFTGCNIENASFTPTCCAERVAIFSAVSAGVRSFSAMAVAGGREGEAGSTCPPCGVCRQVMAEFFSPTTKVILQGEGDECLTLSVEELLPHAFGLSTTE